MKESIMFRRTSAGAHQVTVRLVDGAYSASVTEKSIGRVRAAVVSARRTAQQAIDEMRES